MKNKKIVPIKIYEYMACGITTVASRVGENEFLINDGQNGYLASNLDEWYNNLVKLIQDSDLRKKIGLQGQLTIKNNYSLEVTAKKIIDLIRRI